MSELSPELRELVLLLKRSSMPTEADSARILAALRCRLGDAALMGVESAQAASAPQAVGLLWGKAGTLGFAGLVLLAGNWILATHPHQPAVPESSALPRVVVSNPVEVAPNPTLVTPSARASLPSPTTEVARAPKSNPEAPLSAHSARDRLGEEVELLSRSEAAIHSGRPAVALQLLNEHERNFRNGQLAEERIAARIQALCAMGRKGEADAQLAQLSPGSLHGAQSRTACGSSKGNQPRSP